MKKSLLILFVLVLFLAGCSANASNPGQRDAKGSGAPDNVTLNFMVLGADEVPAYNKIIEEFNKTNPNIKVEVSVVPGTDKFITALKAKYSAGDAPDLYAFQVGARTDEFAKAGLLMDLTNEPLMANIKKEDLDLVTYKGKVYAAPINYQASGIYINDEVFSKYGVKAPENFDEFLAVNKELRDKGLKYPMVMGGKDVGLVAQFDFQYLSTVILHNDPEYYSKILKGELHFNSPVMKEMFEKYGKLREYMSPDSLGVDADEAVKRFVKGDGAMLMSGTWSLAPIRHYAPDLKVSMVPSALQDKTQERILNVGVSSGIHITSSTKHPNEAKKLAEFLLTPAMGVIYSKEAKQLSTIKGVKEVYDPSLIPMMPWLDGNKKSPHADSVWIPGIKDVMKEITQKWFLGDNLDQVLNQWEEQHQRLIKGNPSFVENFGKEE